MEDFLNSGFIDQDQIDETINLDIDKYFLETTRDSLTLDTSLLRCAQSSRGQTNFQYINYSPIAYESYHSPAHKFQSPLQKIHEGSSFDMSDSCFLCTTTNINNDEFSEESIQCKDIYQHFLQVSDITDHETQQNPVESCIDFETSDELVSQVTAKSTYSSEKYDQSSVFKRNESGRISCHTIYNYLIKPIKKKFNATKKSAKSSAKLFELEKRPSHSITSSKDLCSFVKPVASHIYSNVLPTKNQRNQDTNINCQLPNERTNMPIGLADQFHKCGDLVYYLV